MLQTMRPIALLSMLPLLMAVFVALSLTATEVSAFGDPPPPAPSQAKALPHPEITRVHLMFMNHLDVGYSLPGNTGFSANVINTYMNVYFVRAVNVSRDLRRLGFLETFSYLVHPWMLEMFFNCPQGMALHGIKLQCPSQSTVEYVTQGVLDGAIQWHAGSMNVQYETCLTSNLLQVSLDSAKRLDAMFGIKRRFSAVSLRDVPGLTRSSIDLMAKNGIVAVTNGINWACPSVDLGGDRRLVRWRSPSGSEVFYNKIPGGYPANPGPDPSNPGGLDFDNCLQAPGTTEVQCWAFRSDNTGPPVDYKEVVSNYEVLRGEFPNAAISASTMERFWALVVANRASVPVFNLENGDTWLQGDQADFYRMSTYRGIARALDQCVTDGACHLESPDMVWFSRWIAKAAEHTYGLNGVYDYVHYSNRDFHRVMDGQNYQLVVSSWLEQRQFLQLAVNAAPAYLATYLASELAPLDDPFPNVGADFVRLDDKNWDEQLTVGSARVVFNRTAGLSRFSFDSGANWHQGGGRFIYRTYNESDTAFFLHHYTNQAGDNTGFGKYNSTINAHPVSQLWSIGATGLYKHRSQPVFAVRFSMDDPQSSILYGAPTSMWSMYNFTGTGYTLHSWVLGKQPTRLMEALYVDFPAPAGGAVLAMNKLGQDVTVGEVATNGSFWQHMVGHSPYSVAYRPTGKPEMRTVSLDSSLACPYTATYGPTVWPVPMNPVPNADVKGVAFNLVNNVWDTNFVFWYPYLPEDANFRARFRVDLASKFEDSDLDGGPLYYKQPVA